MKTKVISDIHLTHRFDEKKNAYLEKVISDADFIIINGDFWDYYETTFDKFVKSKYKDTIFPLLKSKNARYHFGNHDMEKWCDERINLFCTSSGYEYKIKAGKYTLHIEHGNRLAPSAEERHPWILNRFTGRLATLFWDTTMLILRRNALKMYEHDNTKIKAWIKENFKENEILVCGHVHVPEFNLKQQYINHGMIRSGYGQYLVVDGDKIEFIDEKY